MKKTLYSLFAVTTILSTPFAASDAADKTTSVVNITASSTPVKMSNIIIPSLYFDQTHKIFAGSPIELIINEDAKVTLYSHYENPSDRDSFFSVSLQKNHTSFSDLISRISSDLAIMGISKKNPETPEQLYNTLCIIVSKFTKSKIDPNALFKLREITVRVFPNTPYSWMLESLEKLHVRAHEITRKLFNKYSPSNLRKTLKEKLSKFKITDDKTIDSLALESYAAMTSSPECPQEIKSAFIKISEILAVAANQYRVKKNQF